LPIAAAVAEQIDRCGNEDRADKQEEEKTEEFQEIEGVWFGVVEDDLVLRTPAASLNSLDSPDCAENEDEISAKMSGVDGGRCRD
jgi:hypothetical protein